MNPAELLTTSLTGDPIEALAAIRELRELFTTAEHQHVLTLRRHGASWGLIGRQLGTTRQAARERFAHWTPTRT